MRPHRTRRRLKFGLELAFSLVLNIFLGAPSAQGVTITGTVSSTDGGPFTSGSVVIENAGGGAVSEGFPIPERVTQFSFSLGTPYRDLHWPRSTATRNYQVTVSGGDHYIAPFPFSLTCPNDLPPDYWGFPTYGECEPALVSVALSGPSDAGNIEGTVKRGGKPVGNATVIARQVTPLPWQGGYPRIYVTTTDETGYYSFRYPGEPDVFGVWVRESGSEEYDVAVYPDLFLEDTKRVTVHPAAFSRVNVELRAPMDRAKETAQGPQACQNLVGSPINVTTGNMYTQQEDLAYPSAFGRFAFTRTYNSQSTFQGPFGLGWTHPYLFEHLEVQPGVIRLRNGSGTVRYYELVPGSTEIFRITAPARETSTLVKNAAGFTEQEQSGHRREFDTLGRLTQIVTRSGWTTTLTYAGDQLATVTDPGGRTLTFSYSGNRITRVDGPGGLYAQYGYDADNRLITVTDGLGVRWRYTYTETTLSDTTPSRLAGVQDGNGNRVEQHTYDTQDRVVATSGPGGTKVLTLEYLDATHTRVTDSLGRVTTYTFDIFGDLPLVTQIQGPCTCGQPDSTNTYDAQGRLLTTTDARGKTTQREYDAAGNLIRGTDALDQVTTYTYNAFGQVLTATDPRGATTKFDYHPITGVLVQITNALGHVTTLTPDARQLPGVLTDPRGNATTLTYGTDGLLTARTDSSGASTSFAYDAAGRLIQVTDALQGKITSAFDARGQLLSVTDPVGAKTLFSYDAAGNRVGLTDSNGRVTSYSYDEANRLIAVTDPAGGTTHFAYDLEGNLLTLTDARGSTTAFAYDAHNRLVSRTDPLGAAEVFLYDGVGNLVSSTDRKGQTLTFTYDSLNRLMEKTLPNATVVSYAYDPLGRLLSVTDPNGPLAFTYDALGRVLTATSQDGRTLTYTYDAVGNRVVLQDETGASTTYAYDSRNLLTSLTDPRTGAFIFTYDQLGRRSGLVRPNGTQTSYTYDPASRLRALAHSGPGGTFEGLTYGYDPAGNRTEDSRNLIAHQYSYDPLDQLTEVKRRGPRGRLNLKEAYTYDPVGNRLTDLAGKSQTHDAANRVTSDGTFAYRFDANGNLIEHQNLTDGTVTTYAYDAEDRLVRAVTPTAEVDLRYDPLGRRTEKRVMLWVDGDADGEPDPEEEGPPRVTRYLYAQEDILATFRRNGRERARYTHGPGIDEPLAETRRLGTRFYHADVLGSVIALSDPSGLSNRAYRYSAFGFPEDHRGDLQPFRFTGREWDKEIDLYYYRARYYHPQVGRFLGPDPIPLDGGVWSLYVYVYNSPANFVDPSGLFFQEVFEGAANVSAGFGDTITLGGTKWIRGLWGQAFDWRDAADPRSGTYYAGAYSGLAWGILFGGAAAAASAEALAVAAATGEIAVWAEAIGTIGAPFWRYVGPNSDPNSPWLTRGWKPPCGENFPLAKDLYQIPRMPTSVTQVPVRWWEPVAGPRVSAGNPQWGGGGGMEYYRGWRFGK